MLQHLATLDPTVFGIPTEEFTPLERVDPTEMVVAQELTANWLEELGVPLSSDAQQHSLQVQFAREAFVSMTGGAHPEEAQRVKLAALKSPAAVRHLTGMLAAYDWEFVEQAREIRGYAVSQIVEMTKHPDPKIKMKALDMLGKITEIGLFTEKIEITKGKEASDEELDKRIRERLAGLQKVSALAAPADPTIDDVTAKEAAP